MGQVVDGEMGDLAAASWVTPPTLPRSFPAPVGPVDETSAAANALLAMRDEERG